MTVINEEMRNFIKSKYSIEQIRTQIDLAIGSDYADFKVAYATIASEMSKYNKMIDEKCYKTIK